jgi:hypothetical protein
VGKGGLGSVRSGRDWFGFRPGGQFSFSQLNPDL